MSATAKKLSRRQVAYLYALKKQLAITDEDYRYLLETAAGVDSTNDLDPEGMDKVLKLLEDLGEIPPRPPAPDYGNRPGMASPKQLRYLEGLRREIYGDKTACFQDWLEKHFMVTHIRFLDKKTAGKVIEGLKAMQKKQRSYQK